MWGSLALLSSSGLFASGFFVVGWGSVACSVLCVLSLSVLFRACQWVMVPVSGERRGGGGVGGWPAGRVRSDLVCVFRSA